MTRGLKNNNPLNIRNSSDLFQGEIRPSGDKAFKQFRTPAYGYRAAFVTLATYLGRGWDTVEKIVQHWAPPAENDTNSYIRTIEKLSGINRTKILTADSGEDYIKIVIAMSLMENGVNADPEAVRSGFNMQNKLKSHLY